MMRHAGWTLIELLLVLALSGLLAAAGTAGWRQLLLRQHRVGAVQALLQAEAAQGRWRAERPAWATRWGEGGLGLPPRSADGRWQFSVDETDAPEAGVTLRARAQGPQREDTPCRTLALSLFPEGSRRGSGPDDALGNDAATDRRCWGAP
jgi:type IV pilus assembly protein PilE